MNNFLNDIQPYILNETNMINYLKYKLNTCDDNKKTVRNDNFKKQSFIFTPREEDTLFWCFYIIKNGDIKYETLNNRNSIIAKQNKIDYIKKIRENKQIVKMYKFDTLTNVENNLANDKNINIKTIMTLCAIENINLIFVDNKTYFEFLMNDSDVIYIIRQVNTQSKYVKKYGYEIANDNILYEIKNSLYKIENLEKPIKSLSSYKVQDLIEICDKLAIETKNDKTNKNKTKNELYESLVKYFE
jgi:hypothetical protein